MGFFTRPLCLIAAFLLLSSTTVFGAGTGYEEEFSALNSKALTRLAGLANDGYRSDYKARQYTGNECTSDMDCISPRICVDPALNPCSTSADSCLCFAPSNSVCVTSADCLPMDRCYVAGSTFYCFSCFIPIPESYASPVDDGNCGEGGDDTDEDDDGDSNEEGGLSFEPCTVSSDCASPRLCISITDFIPCRSDATSCVCLDVLNVFCEDSEDCLTNDRCFFYLDLSRSVCVSCNIDDANNIEGNFVDDGSCDANAPPQSPPPVPTPAPPTPAPPILGPSEAQAPMTDSPDSYTPSLGPPTGPPTDEPPIIGPPTGPPTDEPPTIGPPTIGPPTDDPQIIGSPTIGPPTDEPPMIGPPTGPPTDEPPTVGPSTIEPSASLPIIEDPTFEPSASVPPETSKSPELVPPTNSDPATPSLSDDAQPTISTAQSTPPNPVVASPSASQSDNSTGICIGIDALEGMHRSQLVYATHRRAAVLCDQFRNCATPGHMVTFDGSAMSMSEYCAQGDVVCDKRVTLVNSPKMKLGLRVASRSDRMQFTALAAAKETWLEIRALKLIVALGA